MRLLVRDGDNLIETRSFDGNVITIGSSDGCDIKIPDRRILPKQLVITLAQDDIWSITPAEGGLPIVLNRRPVNSETPLKHADEIGIDNYTIAVYGASGDSLHASPTGPVIVPAEVAKLRAHPLPAGSITKTVRDDFTMGGKDVARIAALSYRLASTLNASDLVEALLEIALDELHGQIAYAGTRSRDYGSLEFVQGRDNTGRIIHEPPLSDTFQYRCLERGQSILITSFGEHGVGSAMAAPLTCSRGELGILYVDRPLDAAGFHKGDLDFLSMMTALAAAQLCRIVEADLNVQQATSQGQLAFLRELQTRLDPATVPQWEGQQLAIYCKPGMDQAGDVYDVLRLPSGLSMLFVANLRGESFRCALAMAEVRSAFRICGLHADAPHIFLRSINWMLCEDRNSCAMNSVVLAMNPLTGDLQYSTAGTIGAVIIDARGDSRDLSNRQASPLGIIPNTPYEPSNDKLAPGETLALFTPGACTAENEAGERLGEDRFVESIRDGFGQSASVALDELVQDHAAFFKQGRQSDDITILLIHRVGAPA